MKSVLTWMIWFMVLTVSSNAGTTDIHIGWDGSRFNPPDGRYKIGLALSGGGARGLAQVGVLKALEKSEFQIGAIAGTSIGGIIGGLYAAGYSADSIRGIIEGINFSELFSNRPRRTTMFLTQRPEKERSLISIRFDGFKPHIPRALTAGQKLSDLLSSLTLRANYTSGGDFLKLKYPFNSITTDIITGRQVNLASGNLADAIRSTMAFPLAFTGVENGDMILMDGGIMNPIPVDAVPDCNDDLDMILAINTTSDLLSKDAIRDPIDIANQVTSIMQLDKIKAGLEMANAVITPDIAGYYSNDFKYAPELIALGYEAGTKKIAEIENNLDKYLRPDSIYIASMEFTALPANFDTADFPYRTGMVIEKRVLREVASRLYVEKGLFSIIIKALAQDSAAMGYQAYNLEIEAVAMPDIDRLKFAITGNNIFDDTTIISLLKDCWKKESSIGLMNFSNVLCKLYESRGFDLAHIRHIGYDQESKLMSIDIDEAIIEKIEIFGNQRTKDWLIKSSFPPDDGEPFNSRDASRGIAHIYGTDLFNRVTMNILPDTGGAVVKIAVEEKKYTQVRLGWHWHDEYRSEQFIEILDDNLFGTGQELLSHAQYAPRRQKYELSLKADRFFSTYLTYQIKGYYRFLKRNVYGRDGDVLGDISEDSRGISFTLGQQIFRFGTVSGEIRWEDIESKYAPSGDYEKIKLRTATLRSHVETIDKYPFPTEGKIHLFYIEFASEILGGVTQYTKGFSSVESYFPLSSRINLHPRLSIGWTETDNNIPVSEKFYLGGRYSFRGFKTDELVGDKMILGNLDLRFRLPYRFYLSGHYDVGEVYRSADQIKLRNLRHGYGISIAYDSPLGPIDFCYGKANENKGRWYLNIGLNF